MFIKTITENYEYNPRKTLAAGAFFGGACLVSLLTGGYFIFDAAKGGFPNLGFIKDTIGKIGEGAAGGTLVGLGGLGLLFELSLINGVKKELRNSCQNSNLLIGSQGGSSDGEKIPPL